MSAPLDLSGYDCLAHANGWRPEILFGLCFEYLHPGGRLLDLGIGTGLASGPFARFGLQVFGLDLSDEMLAACRAKQFAAGLVRHNLSVLPWPFPGGSFDVLVAGGVLHFLPDLAPVFKEAARLLAPGGIFAFTTKQPAHPGPAPYLAETIQATPLYLHQPAYLGRLYAENGFALRKEARLLIRTGRGSDDVFPATVLQKAAGSAPAAQ